ncbi:MAG: hypothetical protein ACPHDO_00780 [Candidatus Poseidoniaceae archaeon]
MKNKIYLWAIALIIVNTGWFFVSQQSATQEINRPGADFAEKRDASITSIGSDSSEFEIYHCFESTNGQELNASVKVQKDSVVIYSWEGTTEDGCVTQSIESSDGNLVVITEVEEGAESTVSIVTWPMKSFFAVGVLIFTIGTVVVAYLEIIVKKTIKNRLNKEPKSQSEDEQNLIVETTGIWQAPIKL